jgi:hypothetical protein
MAIAETRTRSPDSVNTSGTDVAWTDPLFLRALDGNLARNTHQSLPDHNDNIHDETVQLRYWGSVGDNKGNDADVPASPPAGTYIDYGGLADLWGRAWTVDEINDVQFGVSLRYTHYVGASIKATSNYLSILDFDFNIVAGATIIGILVEVAHTVHFGTEDSIRVEHVQVTVKYELPETFQVAYASQVNILIGGGHSDDGMGG